MANTFKRALRWMGIPVHLLPEPLFIKLNKLISFSAIKQLNLSMVQAERDWDGVPSEPDSNTSKTSADYYRNQIFELYTNPVGDFEHPEKALGGDIRDSIGPFTERNALIAEGAAAANGTGFRDEPIEINIGGQFVKKAGKNEILTFSIPKEKTIAYSDGRTYKVAFFGARADSPYWIKLSQEIQEICEESKRRWLELVQDETERSNIVLRIDIINEQYQGLIKIFKGPASQLDNSHRSNLVGGKGVIKHHNVIDTRRGEIMGRKLTNEQVYYTHTYKVVLPKIPKTVKTGELLRDEDGKVIGEIIDFVLDEKGSIVYEYLKDYVPADWKRVEETDYGLDRNGWALEVGWEGTIFRNRELRRGEVLIDLFEGREPRLVPQNAHKFIVDLDLLDVAVWIYVNWDAYRDDLRDGRYHENAITAMECIMAELNIPDIQHPQTLNDIRESRHARIRMNLNKLPVMEGRPANDPNHVDMTITPTNISPAFDLNSFRINPTTGRTIHMGRKYYYELQENTVHSMQPTMTTRGAALYLLHRVIEESKYWGREGDPGPGVLQALQAIGAQTEGFDIGPNLGPGFKRWGKTLTRNPFRPVY